MHDGCFGLTRRPFASVPQVDDYFPASAVEAARTALSRCLQRGEGTGLVVGPSGTGKTLLCLVLGQQFQRSFRVAMLSSGRLGTRRALFQAILYELGRPYRGMDEGELRLAVADDLMAGEASSRGLVLLVDEAHVLPLRLLEELRLLTNLARGDQPLVRLVLAGGSALEEQFASPKLDSFNQRLAARCYLNAFNRAETQAYIQHQITFAGGQAEVLFRDETCQTVFQATGGVPRLINQVCDHAMLLSYVGGRQQVNPADIEEAWADLQQLPTPWSGESGEAKKESAGNGVIEFGTLDESADESARAHASAGASQGAGAPALRISPPLDESESDPREPAQQIHRIEQLLAEADEDFQPAGSIMPEIELRFTEPAPPFAEQFEHEEVINDRYAASRAATGGRLRPLSAYIGSAAALPARNGDPRAPGGEKSTLSSALASTLCPAAISAAPATGPDAAASPAIPAAEPAAASQVFKDDPPPRGGSGKNYPADAGPSPSADLPASKTPDAPPRRPEFRHLFARLRRG